MWFRLFLSHFTITKLSIRLTPPLRRTPGVVPAVSQSFYYNQTLYKTNTSIKTDNGHFGMVKDTCEVLNVTANYDSGGKKIS